MEGYHFSSKERYTSMYCNLCKVLRNMWIRTVAKCKSLFYTDYHNPTFSVRKIKSVLQTQEFSQKPHKRTTKTTALWPISDKYDHWADYGTS